jgi:hypothetical protein
MRIANLVLALVALPLTLSAVPACGDKTMEADPFDTLQACFDEHHNMESLSVHDAIVVCCLDHPIAGVHPSCKDTQADCVAHVDAELDNSVTTSDIQTACTDYIAQKT